MKTNHKIIIAIAVASITILAVATSVSLSLSVVHFWQESGAWFVAPAGYRIIGGGVQFCEEYAYNTNYEVIGFRWKIKTVDAYGYGRYVYVDALVPQSGVWYSWSPYPYGWVEYGGKIRYLAEKYSTAPTVGVWVYAPLEQYTAPTPTPSPSQPTPTPAPGQPTPTPASPTPTPAPGQPTPTPSPDYTPPLPIQPLTILAVACIVVAVLVAVALTKLKKQ